MTDEVEQRQFIMRNAVDVFIVLSIIVLIGSQAFSILAPFVSVVIWATIMAVGVYPAYVSLRRRMGRFGGWASTLIALIGLVGLMLPAILIVESIISSLRPIANALVSGEAQIMAPDESVRDWPLIGKKVFEVWSNASTDFQNFSQNYAEEIRGIASSIVSVASGLFGGVLQFAASIIFAAIFMSYAAPLVSMFSQIFERIASSRGRAMLKMAADTARNVARGVVGVAIIQGGLGAIGILAVGMPFAGVVAALLVGSTLVQAPILVIVPSIAYVWYADTTLVALLFTAFMVPVMLLDNVLKPVLMARGLETPMVIILIGVIGGTVSGGLIGLFTGPVILAVFHKMVLTWIETGMIKDANEDEPASGT